MFDICHASSGGLRPILGAEGYADAVITSGVDACRYALLVVGEDFDDALVDEDA